MSVRQSVVQPSSAVRPVSLLGLLTGRVEAVDVQEVEPRTAVEPVPADDWDDVMALVRGLNRGHDVVFTDSWSASRVAG